VLLLIEVADTSLAYDRDVKLPRYARAGIPEVWLVDLAQQRLLVHRRPAGDDYGEVTSPDDLSAVPLPATGGRRATLDLHALF
jgi:Uma2 family endonuclease